MTHTYDHLGPIAAYMARRGWAVYPQAPETNTPRRNCANCRETDDQPRQCPGVHGGCPCLTSVENPCHALHAASADVDLTLSRWEHARRCNPALHLGRSGLVVLDIDNHGDTIPDMLAPGLPNDGAANGIQSFAILLDHLGMDWPDTLTVDSPTGGVHLYFQAPRVPLRTTLAAWQVEVKAGATSITAPGSLRRVDGDLVRYRRSSDTANPAPFPAWLGEWLVSIGRIPDPKRPAIPTPMPLQRTGESGEHSPAYWDRAWHDQLGEIESAPQGERFHVLGRRGGRLFALAARPGCPWTTDEAERALVDAQVRRAARLGIHAPESEYRAQARSMRDYATRHYGMAEVAR